MEYKNILIIFLIIKSVEWLIERKLSRLNHKYYSDPAKQKEAQNTLLIPSTEMLKTISYTNSKYKFSGIQGAITFVVTMSFLAVGGLGVFESIAINANSNSIVQGLVFVILIMLATTILESPFSYYNTFVIEEVHGFNRQTKKGFFIDLFKNLIMGNVLISIIVALILWIMQISGPTWWVWAVFATTGFSIVAAWLYPVLLAPMFNKFKALEDGELKDKIYELATKIGFDAGDISIMDASRRSTHGNAYFTGLFGKKKIVLYDTLVQDLNPKEIVSVLAHELGHFKLNHIRWQLFYNSLITAGVFYLISLMLPLKDFYLAFGLKNITNYNALIVFTLWFSTLNTIINPIMNSFLRKNEFEADAFAAMHLKEDNMLASALKKMREKSKSMPLSHPWYSTYHFSHPPLVERINEIPT